MKRPQSGHDTFAYIVKLLMINEPEHYVKRERRARVGVNIPGYLVEVQWSDASCW